MIYYKNLLYDDITKNQYTFFLQSLEHFKPAEYGTQTTLLGFILNRMPYFKKAVMHKI